MKNLLEALSAKIRQLNMGTKRLEFLEGRIDTRLIKEGRTHVLEELKTALKVLEFNARRRSSSELYIGAEPIMERILLGSIQQYSFRFFSSEEYKLLFHSKIKDSNWSRVTRLTLYSEFKQRASLLLDALKKGLLDNQRGRSASSLLFGIMGEEGDLLDELNIDHYDSISPFLLAKLRYRVITDWELLDPDYWREYPRTTTTLYQKVIAEVNQGREILRIEAPIKGFNVKNLVNLTKYFKIDTEWIREERARLNDILRRGSNGRVALAYPGMNIIRLDTGVLQYDNENIYLHERNRTSLDISSHQLDEYTEDPLISMFYDITQIIRYSDKSYYFPDISEHKYVLYKQIPFKEATKAAHAQVRTYVAIESRFVAPISGKKVILGGFEYPFSFIPSNESLHCITLLGLLWIQRPKSSSLRDVKHSTPIHVVNINTGVDTVWEYETARVYDLDEILNQKKIGYRAKTAIKELPFTTLVTEKLAK
jgi:hypothetical protein